MNKKIKLVIIFFIAINLLNSVLAETTFFEEAKKNYDKENYNESKFLFQRNIVFNPKDIKSYLYLAKIYKFESNKKEEEKNINTCLLLHPKN